MFDESGVPPKTQQEHANLLVEMAEAVGSVGREQIATRLTLPQRVLLFCVASGTDWRKFGIQNPTVQLTILHGLVERENEQLVLTNQGRAILGVLIERGK
jgi:hypothetical protein